MLYALNPDNTLKGTGNLLNDEGMKNLYQSHFKSELTLRLRNDFQDQGLHKTFIKLGTDSVTIETKMTVGNKEENFMLDTKQNFKLVEMTDPNQVIMIVAKDE